MPTNIFVATGTSPLSIDPAVGDGTFVLKVGNTAGAQVNGLTVDASGNASILGSISTVNALPAFQCRAWVNFNGTGTVAIRASGNVASITDNGVGDYTVNFTTAMPDANYCATFGMSPQNSRWISNWDGALLNNGTTAVVNLTTSIRLLANAGSAADATNVYMAVFR